MTRKNENNREQMQIDHKETQNIMCLFQSGGLEGWGPFTCLYPGAICLVIRVCLDMNNNIHTECYMSQTPASLCLLIIVVPKTSL